MMISRECFKPLQIGNFSGRLLREMTNQINHIAMFSKIDCHIMSGDAGVSGSAV